MKVKSTREDERNGKEPRSPSEQRNHRRPTFVLLDEVDRAILGELTADARIRTAELGRRVGLSAPAIAERLRRLEDSGVVSYRAEVDPRALGYAICAIVRVSPATRDLPRIPETARAIPEITECYRITGEDCYFMTLYLRSIDDLEAVLDRFTPYGRTTTSIVHSAPVPRRGLPLTEPPQS
jgi:Lrp/AsnC family leucine-responsive transcriptional regulator